MQVKSNKNRGGFIHRGFYTTDMTVGSSAVCEYRKARTRTGKGYTSHYNGIPL